MIDQEAAESLACLLEWCAGLERLFYEKRIGRFMAREDPTKVSMELLTALDQGVESLVVQPNTVRDLTRLMLALSGPDGEFWQRQLDLFMQGENPWPQSDLVPALIDPTGGPEGMIGRLHERDCRLTGVANGLLHRVWPEKVPAGEAAALSLRKVQGCELGLEGRHSLGDFLEAMGRQDRFGFCEQWWGGSIRWSHRNQPQDESLLVGIRPIIVDGMLYVWRLDHTRVEGCLLNLTATTNRNALIFGPDDIWLLVERDQS